jgi:hypothetical protein
MRLRGTPQARSAGPLRSSVVRTVSDTGWMPALRISLTISP